MARPSLPCSHPGCPALQPCSQHAPPPWQRTTPRRQPAGSGWAWQRKRKAILERDGYACHYCGAPATVIDHIIGLTFGGTDDESNLVACCRPCNEKKRQREVKARRHA